MGRCYKEIFKLIFFSLLLVVGGTLMAGGASQLQNAELKTFMVPKYNLETKKLEYILTGKDAETVGTLVKINDAKLEVIGKDGNSIDIVITTPEAFYDRVADTVRGDKDVHYRSLQMDADGIGFNVSNLNKTIHIEKDVKMWIYQKGRGSQAVEKESAKESNSDKAAKVSDSSDASDEADTANKEVIIKADDKDSYAAKAKDIQDEEGKTVEEASLSHISDKFEKTVSDTVDKNNKKNIEKAPKEVKAAAAEKDSAEVKSESENVKKEGSEKVKDVKEQEKIAGKDIEVKSDKANSAKSLNQAVEDVDKIAKSDSVKKVDNKESQPKISESDIKKNDNGKNVIALDKNAEQSGIENLTDDDTKKTQLNKTGKEEQASKTKSIEEAKAVSVSKQVENEEAKKDVAKPDVKEDNSGNDDLNKDLFLDISGSPTERTKTSAVSDDNFWADTNDFNK